MHYDASSSSPDCWCRCLVTMISILAIIRTRAVLRTLAPSQYGSVRFPQARPPIWFAQLET